MRSLQTKAEEIFNSLSRSRLKVAIDFLQYLQEKEEWEATEELLNPKTISEIKEGQKQIQEGEFVKIKDIRRDV